MVEPALTPSQLVIGATFAGGRYRIVRCIARGGMGAVYEAEHLQTKRTRALKVMLPSVVESEEARARFKLEATVVSSVESDHIAEVIDAGVDDDTGMPFIVMELLKGEELAALSHRTGAMAHEDVVVFLKHAAYALERTHAAGIVHRDLKPENLFVTRRDDAKACPARRHTSSVPPGHHSRTRSPETERAAEGGHHTPQLHAGI